MQPSLMIINLLFKLTRNAVSISYSRGGKVFDTPCGCMLAIWPKYSVLNKYALPSREQKLNYSCTGYTGCIVTCYDVHTRHYCSIL
jgi:hypothetical protein